MTLGGAANGMLTPRGWPAPHGASQPAPACRDRPLWGPRASTWAGMMGALDTPVMEVKRRT